MQCTASSAHNEQVLKILSRKTDNRRNVADEVVRVVVGHLEAAANLQIAAEGANVLLNICYELENVDLVIRHHGLQPLIRYLSEQDPQVQANAAGAVQSICFQKNGRKAIRLAGAVPSIISLLGSDDTKVCTRSVGALHNVSSDPDSIRIIRRCARAANPVFCAQHSPYLETRTRPAAS